jgi:glc operon protein GlcG
VTPPLKGTTSCRSKCASQCSNRAHHRTRLEAIRKARTAAYFQGETRALEEEVTKGGRTALLPIDGFMPLEGGIPITAGGQMVGAIGVSGVTGAQDAQCAKAGAAIIK